MPEAATVQKKQQGNRGRNQRPRGNRRPRREEREFEQRVVDLARVTRVTSGGKRMSFRATVVVGDKKGRVGYGIAKGKDVQAAIQKAVAKGEKSVIRVPMKKNTIPHAINKKFKAAKVLLKPAPDGTGVIAGGAVRIVLELSGIKDIVGKMLGSTSKHNNVHATIEALKDLQLAAAKKA